MGFSRKVVEDVIQNDELSANEKVQKIMDEHLSWFTPLKDERDSLKDKAADLQKQLDEISGENWQKKFEDEHKAFEDFKAKTSADAEAAAIRAEYRKLLVEEKIGEKWIDRVMESADFSGMKLDKDGNLANPEKLKEALDKKWGDVKTTVTTQGTKVETPPTMGKSTMTKEQILAIKDSSERQKAIAENLNLFGKG